MHRVITMSLNGNTYQIDEDGYKALAEYLDRARARLRNNPDADEILADLERAIAEKCARLVTPNKNVINAAEITQILQEVGPVVGDVAGGEQGAHESGDNAKSETKEPKRLCRIREGAWLGGVCTGLADYFGIDVTLVRIIFAVLTLFNGLGAIAYALVLFFTPYKGASAPVNAGRAVLIIVLAMMASGAGLQFTRSLGVGMAEAILVLILMVVGLLCLIVVAAVVYVVVSRLRARTS